MIDISAILLDIEGTTTPIDFVYHTLFPYARNNFPEWLRSNFENPEIQADLSSLREEHRSDTDQLPQWDESKPLDSAISYLLWLMDRDRKSTALKSLQGRIWEEGYRSGELLSEMYSDVQPALERWKKLGIRIGIYSSGSVQAQKLLFGHTNAGDLTSFIEAWFDTRIGAKREVGSYRRIAESLGIDPAAILFISDVTAELDAAQQAGMMTALSIRPGNPPQPDAGRFEVIKSFEELEV
ncbi:MAG: acireductone synthase [Acidobacteria bacterium]|nr:acireductone synthase [Acidobacteriota bacterium]